MTARTTRTDLAGDGPALLTRLREEQEGATLVMGAIVTTLMLLVTAVVVDLGARVLGDRDIQGAVDIAALDAVTALGALDDGGDQQARAEELATASLQRNPGWSSRNGRTHTTTIGRFDEATRTFTPTTVDPNAVMVAAQADLDRLTGFIPGSDRIDHVAVAALDQLGSIGIGTAVASVDTSRAESLDVVLSGLFGGPVSLDAVSWQGLAVGDVPLRALATSFGVGSVDELLDLQVTSAQLLSAAASGVGSQGEPLDVTAAGILGDLATQVDGERSFRLGDLVAVDQGVPGSVLDADVNALSLVTGAAMLINGNNAVDLGIDLSGIPGVTSGGVSLTVVEPPQIAVGRPGVGPDGTYRTVARSAQVRFATDLVVDPLGDYAGLSVGSVNLPIAVDAGSGWAGFADSQCAADEATTTITNHVETTAASAVFGVRSADAAFTQGGSLTAGATAPLLDISVDTLLLGDVRVASVDATGGTTVPGVVDDVLLSGPYTASERLDGSRPFGDGADTVGALGVGALLDDLGLSLSLLDLPLGLNLGFSLSGDADDTSADVNLVTDVVVPSLVDAQAVVDRVDEQVFGGLADALGIVTVGDAETSAFSLDCGQRRLVD